MNCLNNKDQIINNLKLKGGKAKFSTPKSKWACIVFCFVKVGPRFIYFL